MSLQYHIPLPHRDAMTVDDFMVTDSNRDAWSWIVEKSPKEWPNHCLILHGQEGCGKTHLLRIWQQQHNAKLIEPGSDVLGEMMGEPSAYPAIAIENTHQITGNPEHETWMQHLFNATREKAIPLLLTARLPAKDWALQLADIRSRLCATMTVGLLEPDDALLTSLLMKQFEDRQLRVEYEVIDYLLRHMDRSAASAAKLVEQIDLQALAEKRKITVPLVKRILGQI